MQITSTTSSTGTTADPAQTASSQTGTSTLGQADFLKLLTVQLQQQDPMKPMDDSAFIAQMAQFSSLQQMTTLNTGMKSLQSDSQLSAASGLIGEQVTVTTDKGPVSGVVSAANQTSSGAQVIIDGTPYPYTSITQVTVPTATPTSG